MWRRKNKKKRNINPGRRNNNPGSETGEHERIKKNSEKKIIWETANKRNKQQNQT